MNKFIMGVSSLVEKKCPTAMLRNDMDIARLIVYVEQIEKSKIRDTTQEVNTRRSEESSPPKRKRRFYHKESSMGNKDKVSN